jgi:hypothetical protein
VGLRCSNDWPVAETDNAQHSRDNIHVPATEHLQTLAVDLRDRDEAELLREEPVALPLCPPRGLVWD